MEVHLTSDGHHYLQFKILNSWFIIHVEQTVLADKRLSRMFMRIMHGSVWAKAHKPRTRYWLARTLCALREKLCWRTNNPSSTDILRYTRPDKLSRFAPDGSECVSCIETVTTVKCVFYTLYTRSISHECKIWTQNTSSHGACHLLDRLRAVIHTWRADSVNGCSVTVRGERKTRSAAAFRRNNLFTVICTLRVDKRYILYSCRLN